MQKKFLRTFQIRATVCVGISVVAFASTMQAGIVEELELYNTHAQKKGEVWGHDVRRQEGSQTIAGESAGEPLMWIWCGNEGCGARRKAFYPRECREGLGGGLCEAGELCERARKMTSLLPLFSDGFKSFMGSDLITAASQVREWDRTYIRKVRLAHERIQAEKEKNLAEAKLIWQAEQRAHVTTQDLVRNTHSRTQIAIGEVAETTNILTSFALPPLPEGNSSPTGAAASSSSSHATELERLQREVAINAARKAAAEAEEAELRAEEAKLKVQLLRAQLAALQPPVSADGVTNSGQVRQ